jgi:lipid II isoglutaminyl synthase (glutamine-hydrolysing)
VTVSTRPPPAYPGRATLAVEALKACNRLSRALGRGSGTVAGGRVGLLLDPVLLATLAEGRRVALVSGTNGKTTTTRMLSAALVDGSDRVVATNDTGANMPAGHVSALAGSPPGSDAVLEVDESYLGRLLDETAPRVVVLLNLSRDQLDRIAEVRILADRWRAALSGGHGSEADGRAEGAPNRPTVVVVANADDPMVVWAATPAADVRWVAAGQVWHDDSVGCPACGGGIVFEPGGRWACDRCEFARPSCHAWIDGADLVLSDGTRGVLEIGLPGWFNRANAAMAAVAAPFMTDPGDRLTPLSALARMAGVGEVAGRFGTKLHHGGRVRTLLAKNPAGWTAIFDLLEESGAARTPVVLSINARIADGLDTSWLWDVPFERLAGRRVVATGDRRLDLAVRLRYAEVAATVVSDPVAAVDEALRMARQDEVPDQSGPAGPAPAVTVEFLGNYTAFADLVGRL